MEHPGGGSARRELATPETAAQREDDKDKKQDEAPSGKVYETPTDEELPEDQQAMQPDSE